MIELIIFLGTIVLIIVLLKISPTPKKHVSKKVRFSPNVEVVAISGRKSDRFNPDLHDCVRRNTQEAMRVGGAKILAKMDL